MKIFKIIVLLIFMTCSVYASDADDTQNSSDEEQSATQETTIKMEEEEKPAYIELDDGDIIPAPEHLKNDEK